MKKSRAIFLLIATLVAIGGYVAWAAWEPAPTLDSIIFQPDVDAVARDAAKADFRSHPPKAPKLTWHRFLKRLTHPYQPRKNPTVWVMMDWPPDGGAPLLAISYPREGVGLARSREDNRWHRAYHRAADSHERIAY